MGTRRHRLRWLAGAAACAAALGIASLAAARRRAAPVEAHAAARLAVRRLAAGQIDAARHVAEATLAADPGEADARFVRACLRASAGNRAGAFADLEECARSDPADAAICLDAALVARSLARGDAVWTERARTWFAEASRRASGRDDVRSALIDAAACVALGRIDDAEHRLDTVAAPTGALGADAAALRAAILVARGDEGGARALLRSAAADRPSGPLTEMLRELDARARDPLRDGLDAARRGESGLARDFLLEAARASPDDLTPVALLAATLDGAETARAVEEAARRLGECDPHGAARPLLLANVLLLHGDAEGARPLFRRAIERAPDDPAALRGAVFAALACDDAAEAVSLCRHRIDRGNTAGLADLLLGVSLEQSGDDGLAETSYREALRKNGANWIASDRLAEMLLRRGDVAGAASVCDAGLAADPDCAPLRVRRADVWAAAGDAARAARLLACEAAAHPESSALQLHWGRALAASGDFAGAAARLGACLELDPDCVEARVGALTLAAADHRLESEVAALRTRAESRPRDAVARFALGVAAEMSGDLAAAEREYRAALALEPRFAIAANNLAWLLAARLGRPADARAFAETAGRLLPLNPHVLDTRGWIRFLNGDAAGAEPDLARAVRMLPAAADVAARHASVVAAIRTSAVDVPVPEPPTEVPR